MTYKQHFIIMTLRVTAHGMATFLLYTVVYIHIRKVLELPNSPQDPIIIDLGEKARGKYHHQLLLEGIANSSCSRQCAKKLLIAAYPSRISTNARVANTN